MSEKRKFTIKGIEFQKGSDDKKKNKKGYWTWIRSWRW